MDIRTYAKILVPGTCGRTGKDAMITKESWNEKINPQSTKFLLKNFDTSKFFAKSFVTTELFAKNSVVHSRLT